MKLLNTGLFLLLSVAIVLWQVRMDRGGERNSFELMNALIGSSERELAIMPKGEPRDLEMQAFRANYKAFKKALEEERRNNELETFDYFQRIFRTDMAMATALQHNGDYTEAMTTLEQLVTKTAGSALEVDALTALDALIKEKPVNEMFTEDMRAQRRVTLLQTIIDHPEFMHHPNGVKRAVAATVYVEKAWLHRELGENNLAVAAYQKYFTLCMDQGLITRALIAEWSRYSRLADDLGVAHKTMGKKLSAMRMELADQGRRFGEGLEADNGLTMDSYKEHNAAILMAKSGR